MGLSIFLSLPHGASLSLLLMEMELWWGEEAHHGRAVYTVHGACHILVIRSLSPLLFSTGAFLMGPFVVRTSAITAKCHWQGQGAHLCPENQSRLLAT